MYVCMYVIFFIYLHFVFQVSIFYFHKHVNKDYPHRTMFYNKCLSGIMRTHPHSANYIDPLSR